MVMAQFQIYIYFLILSYFLRFSCRHFQKLSKQVSLAGGGCEISEKLASAQVVVTTFLVLYFFYNSEAARVDLMITNVLASLFRIALAIY
jgi:hypothetical protein